MIKNFCNISPVKFNPETKKMDYIENPVINRIKNNEDLQNIQYSRLTEMSSDNSNSEVAYTEEELINRLYFLERLKFDTLYLMQTKWEDKYRYVKPRAIKYYYSVLSKYEIRDKEDLFTLYGSSQLEILIKAMEDNLHLSNIKHQIMLDLYREAKGEDICQYCTFIRETKVDFNKLESIKNWMLVELNRNAKKRKYKLKGIEMCPFIKETKKENTII